MTKSYFKIALTGNPNSGKTSLFNALTGMNQKVGNFPGVTVDKKTGVFALNADLTAKVIDLPGTYSLYPKSQDEYVTYETLLNPHGKDVPDLIIIVADAANLKRNLLFCSQIIDLKKPVLLALSMLDIARKKGMEIDVKGLERELGIPVVAVNPRKNKGIAELKKRIVQMQEHDFAPLPDFIELPQPLPRQVAEQLQTEYKGISNYAALHLAGAYDKVSFVPDEVKARLDQLLQEMPLQKSKIQAEEVMARYERINHIMHRTVVEDNPLKKQLYTERIDKILLHRAWGYVILLLVLFLMFQAVFWLASYPMDWIDFIFSKFGGWIGAILPESWWADLLVNGVIAGIGGIVIFIPQIAILFFIITILEDTGYMARISFLTDRLLRGSGLNGRSVMPLISGMACAIPAVMAARTIENPKERLLTILVTPLVSCSARLPVYAILIALVIPQHFYLGFISLQGLVFFGLYLLGFVMALTVSRVISVFITMKERSLYLMELPVYHVPRWGNAFVTMYEKAKIFVTDAGRIIIVISLILWALASFGPGSGIRDTEWKYEQVAAQQGSELSTEQSVDFASEKLEHSYAGYLGKVIEPAIRPLGYDWKIGIALLSSFAAREVFVGTMATLYSVGNADDEISLKNKMKMAKRADGTPVYTLASGVSLMIFYAFAMQCMSTLAIVKRETRTWKWPLFQLVYMTAIAYVASLLVYQLLK